MLKKVNTFICFIIAISLMICGCGKKSTYDSDANISNTIVDETAQTENFSGEGYYVFGENISIEVFAQELKQINDSQNSLVIGIDTDYNQEAVERLNQLLKQNGYNFDVVFCKIPDQFLFDGNLIDFANELKNQGIQIDILPVWKNDLYTMAEQGLLTDISAKIEADAELKACYSEKYWDLTSVDGKNYGMGSWYVVLDSWAINATLMQKYGFEKEDLAKNITDLENVLRIVSQGEKTAAFVYDPRIFMESIPFSYVNDTLPIGYWINSENVSLRVENLFDTIEMISLVETMNSYYKKGYVRIEDNASLQDSAFIHPSYSSFPIRRRDALDTWSSTSGIELVRIPYYQKTTDCLVFEINAICSWSEKQDMAWEFLSFINRNKQAATLLQYGVEGEDYSVSEDMAIAGESLTDNVIFSRSLGNLQIVMPLSPYEDVNKKELLQNELDTLQDTPLYGFVFDAEPVLEEVSAVQELYMELSTFRSMFAFETDTSCKNWKEYYDAYNQQLKAAGIDRIVNEMNRQIQEFLQNENKN